MKRQSQAKIGLFLNAFLGLLNKVSVWRTSDFMKLITYVLSDFETILYLQTTVNAKSSFLIIDI